MKKIKNLLIGVLSVSLVLAGGISAFAAEVTVDTPASTTTSSSTSESSATEGVKPSNSSGQKIDWSSLTLEEQKAKAKERLDEGLADGKITQEKYDEVLKTIEDGTWTPEPRERIDWSSLTPEEQTAHAKEHISQRLANGRMTQEEYDEALAAIEAGTWTPQPRERIDWSSLTPEEQTAHAKEHISQHLANGRMTQEEYDEALAAIEAGTWTHSSRKTK